MKHKRFFPRPLLTLAVLGCFMPLIVACGSTPIAATPVEVLIPVQVPCKVPDVAKPAFALDAVSLKAGLYAKGAAALAEIEQRKAYEARLESALKACQ